MKHIYSSLIFTLSLGAFALTHAMPPGGGGQRPEFSTIDADGDGLVSLEEFQAQEIPRGDPSEIFGHIDADEDGYITEEEFTSHKPPRREGRSGSREEQS